MILISLMISDAEHLFTCLLYIFSGEMSVQDLCQFLIFFFFWPRRGTRGILVPRAGLEPGPSAVKVQSPNHWTARKFLPVFKLDCLVFLLSCRTLRVLDVSLLPDT